MPTSCLLPPRDVSLPRFGIISRRTLEIGLSVSESQRVSSGLKSWARICYVYLPKGRLSLNIKDKIILNHRSSPRLELRRIFRFLTLVLVISSLKRTNFALASFPCRAYYRSYINNLYWESNPGYFGGGFWSLFLQSPLQNKRISFECHSSIVLEF